MTEAGFARPLWLRALTLGVALALHGAMAWFFVARVAPLAPEAPDIEISLDAAPAEAAAPPPAETPAPAPTPSETPTPAPTPTETPTPIPTPTETPTPSPVPPPVPVQPTPPPPKPTPTPKPTPPRPTPSATPKPRPTPTERPTPAQPSREEVERRDAERKARDDARKAREETRKTRESQAGDSSKPAAASGADSAAYGATIRSEIEGHVNRSGAAEGRVVVEFTVGANGRIVSHSIVSSTGAADLVARVNAALQSVQASAPPGGRFRGRVTVKFNGG